MWLQEYDKKRKEKIAALEEKRRLADDEITAKLSGKTKKIDPEQACRAAQRLSSWQVRKPPKQTPKQRALFRPDFHESPARMVHASGSTSSIGSLSTATTPSTKVPKTETSVLLEQLNTLAETGQQLDTNSELAINVMAKLRQEELLGLEVRKYKRHTKPLEQRAAQAEFKYSKIEKRCLELAEQLASLEDENRLVKGSVKHYKVQLNEALRSKEKFYQQFCANDTDSVADSSMNMGSQVDMAEYSGEIADLKRQLKNRDALYNTARVVSTEAVSELNDLRQNMGALQKATAAAKETAAKERQRHKDAVEKIKERTAQNQQVHAKLERTREELSDARSRVSKLEYELGQMRETVREHTGQVSHQPAFMRAKKGHDREVIELREQLEFSTKEQQRLEQEVRKLRKSMALRQHEFKTRADDLKRRDEALAEREAAATASSSSSFEGGRETRDGVATGRRAGRNTGRAPTAKRQQPPPISQQQQQQQQQHISISTTTIKITSTLSTVHQQLKTASTKKL